MQGCAFWGFVYILVHLMGQIPQQNPNIWGANSRFQAKRAKKFKLSYFRNYCTDWNQIVHNDKDRQVPFVVVQICRRCRAAAVFKNRKNRYISAMG